LTAGLEAELTLAVAACVMLQRNTETKQGLINGAIGTVTSISSQKVMVKFDHIDNACPIEMVRSKFLNQACASLQPARDWFLEITFVRDVSMLACVCVCVPTLRLLITSGMMWCDIEPL